MATTTPNFGWPVPTSTDLVKDGATAMEALGDAIDTSMVDLKGGTTGQVLAKASNTDMDFSWVAQDDSNAIQNTIVDAKGDLITATAADTPARLAVGTNGQVLTADSTAATGLKWATSGASATSYSLLNTGGTTLSGASTVTISSLSGYNKFHILVKDAVSSSYSNYLLRFNSDTSAIYSTYGGVGYGQVSYTSNVIRDYSATNSTSAFFGKPSGDNTSTVNASIRIDGANSSGIKVLEINSGGNAPSNDGNQMVNTGGTYTGSSVISSVSFICGGTWTSGTVYIYGAN